MRLPSANQTNTNAFKRPLSVLLAFVVCVSVLFLPASANSPVPRASGSVSIYLIHDRNGNGQWDLGIDAVPTVSGVLGISGTNGNPNSSTATTTYFAGVEGLGEQNVATIHNLSPGTYTVSTQLSGSPPLIGQTSFTVGTEPQNVILPLYAQSGQTAVQGAVLLQEDHTPLPGCTVRLFEPAKPAEPGWLATTGVNGYYEFSGLHPGTYQVEITQLPQNPAHLRYRMEKQQTTSFLVLDQVSTTAEALEVGREVDVRFYVADQLVETRTGLAYGGGLQKPVVDQSYLTVSRWTYRQITGWYQDAQLTKPWEFGQSTLEGHTDLHAAFTLRTYNNGSTVDSDGSKGRLRPDPPKPPAIRSVEGVYRDGEIHLQVTLEGVFDVFEYQWQVWRDGLWHNLPYNDEAVCRFSGGKPGERYSFRVIVTRNDGAQNTSDMVTVAIPSDTAPLEGLPAESAPPPTPTTGLVRQAEELRIAASEADKLYEGGRVTIRPSRNGGVWEWPKTLLTVQEDQGDAMVFTALKRGDATVRYRLDGEEAALDLQILEAALPATGQSLRVVFSLAGAGALCLIGAAILHLLDRNRQKGGRGDVK